MTNYEISRQVIHVASHPPGYPCSHLAQSLNYTSQNQEISFSLPGLLKMADKIASVYIVDVGRSMGERKTGREESDLDFALRWVWDKITSTVITERKTDTIGVIGLRTDGE